MTIITVRAASAGSRGGRMGRSQSMAGGLAVAEGWQGCWSMAI
jgi:hypothetical protein